LNYAVSNPNVSSAINSTGSSGAFALKLISAFTAGGWTVHATITGGKTLSGVSPQGYTVYCDVWASDASTVSVMLRSAVGSGCSGYAHQLHWNSSYAWQVFTHPCGFFVSRPATGSTVDGSSCMGGIPMVAGSCGIATALGSVSEVWFSFGDWGGSPFFPNRNPRSGIDVDESAGTILNITQTGCWNGVMSVVNAGTAPWDAPEILRFSPAALDGINSRPLFYGEVPLDYPALIAWPASPGGPVMVRGQIYNAAVRSLTTARNASALSGGYAWISYTDSYYWGTLLVLSSPAASVGNIAY
jgi:hypothetical protein